MFTGWMKVNGVELLNAERTEAYMKHQAPGISFRARYGGDQIHVALEDDPYESPLVDDAPWVNRLDPATHGFYGMYPMSIEGLGDSTGEVTITESILAGGTIGDSRDATRAIKVTGLLLAESELSLEAGLTWLRAAVKTTGCGTHGLTCGSNDLQWFLSEPKVCAPLFQTAWLPSVGREQLGSLTPSTSPVIYRFTDVLPDQPSHAFWELPSLNGVVVQWGAYELDSTDAIYESAVTALLRTNYIKDPQFAGAGVGWSIASGTFTKHTTDGPGNGSYAEVVGTVPPVVRTNWIADPSFESDPAAGGWRSNGLGGVVQTGDPSTFYGDFVATIARDPAQPDLWIETSLLGPVEATAGAVSLEVAQTVDPVTIAVLTPAGVVVSTVTFSSLTAPWQRISTNTTIGAGYVVHVSTPGTVEFRTDGWLAEGGGDGFGVDGYGTDAFGGSAGGGSGSGYGESGFGGDSYGDPFVNGAYFDGDFPDDDAHFIQYFYLGDPATTASRTVKGDGATFVLTALPAATPFGELIAQFKMRSSSSAQVTVDLVALDDAAVLATHAFLPTEEWDTYSIYTPFGRNVKLRFTAFGSFDLSQVSIESGSLLLDFFDGTPDASTDYVNAWLASPNASLSTRKWIGSSVIELPDSRWRPFISAIQGNVPDLALDWWYRAVVPIVEQLQPYQRTHHEVGVFSGPLITNRFRMQRGVGMTVEIIFQAGNPFQYSNDQDIDMTSLESFFFSDQVTNYFHNPLASSSGTNLTAGGNVTVAAVSSDAFTGWPTQGTKSFKMTATSTGESYAYHPTGECPVAVPNEPWVFAADMWNQASASRIMEVGLQFLDSAGLVIGSSFRTTSVVPSHTSHRIAVTAVAPAGTATVRPFVGRAAGGGAANTDVFYAVGLQLERGSIATPFFSGSSVDTDVYSYAWNATVADSASVKSLVVDVTPLSKLVDPDCPPLALPPRPTAIPALCVDEYTDWQRYVVPIPAADVADWAYSVPTLELTTKTDDVRQVRVRFHPNPFGYAPEQVDPQSYCGEFILSYLPKNSRLTVNGMMQRAFAEVAGDGAVTANQLLFGTGGSPMTWPELSCGIDYLMSIDIPPTGDIDNLELALVLNRRE
jgi:hypothetical protein